MASKSSLSGRRPHIVVVGSINMDLVTQVPTLPRPGQTVHGSALRQIPGGKGANQAVAAARLDARCSMLGRVGDDSFGQQLVAALESHGVRTGDVLVTTGISSGLALIGVEDSGENAITIVAGANGRLTADDVSHHEDLLASAGALLLQLEVPYAAVLRGVELARRHGVLCILDPAPAPADDLPEGLWQVDILTPNESEAEQLSGQAVSDIQAACRIARSLQSRGPKHVVLKLGERGAMICDSAQTCTLVSAARVEAVDTTAAGDAFTAAMAVSLARVTGLVEAVRFACAAGTLATMRLGAQPSMPSLAEVEQFLDEHPAAASVIANP